MTAGGSSVLTSWTATLLSALDERHVDVDALLAAAGLDATVREDPERRIPLEASTILWDGAIGVVGDDAFGIDVSRHVRAGTFHGLGQAFMTSPTLRAALERAARYSRVTADLARCTTHLAGHEFVYVCGWQEGHAKPSDASIDAAIAAILRGARAMLGRELSPTRVELIRPAPINRARFDGFFRCPLHFAAPTNLLAFDRADVERLVPGGNDRLASIGDRTVAQYLSMLEPATTAGQVRAMLVDALVAGEPDVEAMASELAMSGRTLQRRLSEEGTSFREVLSSTRCELAQALLSSDAGTVTTIGHRLGFSETAAFSRAFRRWTGQSPGTWRRDRNRPGQHASSSGPSRADEVESARDGSRRRRQ